MITNHNTMDVERYDPGSDAAYHADDGVSNSRLSVAINNPRDYYEKFVAKIVDPVPPTKQQRIGTLLHELVLYGSISSAEIVPHGKQTVTSEEHDRMHQQLRKAVCIPDNVLNDQGHCRGKAYTDFAKQFDGVPLMKADDFGALADKLANSHVVPDGADVVTDEECEVLYGMRASLASHPAAAKLLFSDDGESEVALRGHDETSDLLLRCKLDRYRPGRCVVDLKTTVNASPQSFAKSVFSFGYHRQQVFYSRLVSRWCGEDLPFYFVAIEKTRPYRVEVYQLEPEWLVRGEIEVDSALRTIADCQRSNQWDFSHFGDVLSLPMPRFIKYQDEWEI